MIEDKYRYVCDVCKKKTDWIIEEATEPSLKRPKPWKDARIQFLLKSRFTPINAHSEILTCSSECFLKFLTEWFHERIAEVQTMDGLKFSEGD